MSRNLTFTVEELNNYVKKLFDFEPALKRISVRGEISNLSISAASHVYFTLKDENACIRCAFFNGKSKLNSSVKNNDKVIVTGSVSLYVKGGDYQLIVSNVEYSGIGYWYEKFHKMKEKLEKEGLFNEEFKKPLPEYPKTVGIITSATGAAIDDVLRVLTSRYPLAKALHYPVMVQGVGAANTIANAINYFSENNLADVIILTRGGGSAEDLWEFNEEVVARAIFDCSIPLISAIGHERDFSISDFVADVREATPSTAAARAVPNIVEIFSDLDSMINSLNYNLVQSLNNKSNVVKTKMNRLSLLSPIQKLNQHSQTLDYFSLRLKNTIKSILDENENNLTLKTSKIESLNPLSPLKRGYMIAMDDKDNILHTASEVIEANEIKLMAEDDSVRVKVI